MHDASVKFSAVVVAHLVEQLLLAPDIRTSNPVIGNFMFSQLY